MRHALWIALIAVAGLTGAVRPAFAEPRVLLVGDSWAEEMWEDGSHQRVFDDAGLTEFVVDGAETTESGSTAAEWAQDDWLGVLTGVLADRPEIEVVQLTAGGNDFLETWNTDFSDAETEALKDQIRADLTTVTDHLLGQDPELEILLSFYDYPNFVDTLGGLIGLFFCSPLHASLGEPDPEQINEAALEFESIYAGLAADHPAIHFSSHFGLMQANFGFPDEGIPPGQINPPGHVELPSPPQAMRDRPGLGLDCFHLSPGGYDLMVQNLVDSFYRAHFLGEAIFRDRFEAAEG